MVNLHHGGSDYKQMRKTTLYNCNYILVLMIDLAGGYFITNLFKIIDIKFGILACHGVLCLLEGLYTSWEWFVGNPN